MKPNKINPIPGVPRGQKNIYKICFISLRPPFLCFFQHLDSPLPHLWCPYEAPLTIHPLPIAGLDSHTCFWHRSGLGIFPHSSFLSPSAPRNPILKKFPTNNFSYMWNGYTIDIRNQRRSRDLSISTFYYSFFKESPINLRRGLMG